MSRQLVCLYDGSKCADAALNYAIEKAQLYKTNNDEEVELNLIYVIDYIRPLTLYSVFNIESEKDKAHELLEDAKHIVDNHNVQCTYSVKFNKIKKVVSDLNCDEIFIGHHGYNKLNEVIIGSTAKSIISYANCPVTVIKDTNNHKVYDEVKVDPI